MRREKKERKRDEKREVKTGKKREKIRREVKKTVKELQRGEVNRDEREKIINHQCDQSAIMKRIRYPYCRAIINTIMGWSKS